jgi:hypothetical protein
VENTDAYQKMVHALKRRRKGVTVADTCAATALPLSLVRELLPKAADEYSGRLQVTASGEILYTFPQGFTSRYRGFRAAGKKFMRTFTAVVSAGLKLLFKVWIVVMLIGYFVFFLTLAVLSVFITIAAQSKSSSSNRRGSVYMGPNLFSLLWRLWFYSELTRPNRGYTPAAKKSGPKRRIHKAVFSFVFGEEDPNRDWTEREQKAIIAYIQANRGVISLAEYMVFSGEGGANVGGADAESILAFCARFGGSPEITEEGTIVYRFDELLLRADSGNFAELSPPVKRLKTFSSNSKNMNVWFIIINAVNLIFGSYFLYNSPDAGSFLYSFTYALFQAITPDPAALIRFALGLTPFVFSLLFWLIPAVRRFAETRENEETKLANFKRFGFSKIWQSPLNVMLSRFTPSAAECRPKNMSAAGERVIKEIGVLSVPEVEIDVSGEAVYSFNELENEKRALERYRLKIDPARSVLGETVFDSGE